VIKSDVHLAGIGYHNLGSLICGYFIAYGYLRQNFISETRNTLCETWYLCPIAKSTMNELFL